MGVVYQVAEELQGLSEQCITTGLSMEEVRHLALLGVGAAALLKRFQEEEDRRSSPPAEPT